MPTHLELINDHPWWSDHANRKLALQNLPVEYRWMRTHEFWTSNAYTATYLLYPSDWHNVVEYLMPTYTTAQLCALLHDLHANYEVGSYDALWRWRTAVGQWLNRFHGSSQTLLNHITRADKAEDPDNAHLPAQRALRWSQRIRSQKRLLEKIANGEYGEPSYEQYYWGTGDSCAEVSRMRPKLERRLVAIKTRIAHHKHDLNEKTKTRRHIDGGYGGRASQETVHPWRRQLTTVDGKFIVLPGELLFSEIVEIASTIMAAGFTPDEYVEIPAPKVDENTKNAQQAFAYAMLGEPDLLEFLDYRFRGWKRAQPAAAHAPGGPTLKSLMQKYAVPITYEDMPRQVLDTPDDTPIPEWP